MTVHPPRTSGRSLRRTGAASLVLAGLGLGSASLLTTPTATNAAVTPDEDIRVLADRELARLPMGTLDDAIEAMRAAGLEQGVDPAIVDAAIDFVDARFRFGWDGYWNTCLAANAGSVTLAFGDESERDRFAAAYLRVVGESRDGLTDTEAIRRFGLAIESLGDGINLARQFSAAPAAIFVAEDAASGAGRYHWAEFESSGASLTAWHGSCNRGAHWIVHPGAPSEITPGTRLGFVGLVVEWADGSRSPVHLKLAQGDQGGWQVIQAVRTVETAPLASFEI